MAQTVSIDTLKASETLQAAGLDATSAKAVVSVISEAIATTAATKHDLDNAETRLSHRMDGLAQEIKDSAAALDKKIDTEITELRAEVNIGFATLDRKMDVQFATLDKKIEVQGAELRTEISDSVNKMTRNVAGLIGLALGLVALWSIFGPVASTLPTP